MFAGLICCSYVDCQYIDKEAGDVVVIQGSQLVAAGDITLQHGLGLGESTTHQRLDHC